MDLRSVSAPYPRPAAIIESGSRGLAPVSNAHLADYFSAADLASYRSYAEARPVPAPSMKARAAGFAESADSAVDSQMKAYNWLIGSIIGLSVLLLAMALWNSRRVASEDRFRRF